MIFQQRFAWVTGPALMLGAFTLGLTVETDDSNAQRDARVELIKKAVIFEGSTFGFEESRSPARAAFESILEEHKLQPFVALLDAPSPAAKAYGAQGLTLTLESLAEEAASSPVNAELRRAAVRRLTSLLDDDRPLELFVSCEHRLSAVGIEAFGALAQILPDKKLDAVVADIFREAVATQAFPLKFQLALSRSKARPTMESLGFLLHRYLNIEAGAILLDPAPALDDTLRAERIEAVDNALRSQQPDLRLAGIGAARDLAAPTLLDQLVERTNDTDDRVSAYALRVLATNRTPFLIVLVTGQSDRALKATVAHSRSALEMTPARRQAAAELCAALAQVLATRQDHTGATASPVSQSLLENLRISLLRVPERQVPVAKAIAAIDRGGHCSRTLLQDHSASLHPQAFLVIARKAAGTKEGRAKTIALLLSHLVNEEAPKKQRLYAARGLGVLNARETLGELTSISQNAAPRLARETTKAIGRIHGQIKTPARGSRP